jgi:predicted AAA+ superfamily ATPase
MTALYHVRELSRLVGEALESLPVVVVSGLRQSGKTTFLRSEPGLADRRYFSLDDFATLEAARRQPEALVAGDEPVTIDEAQRCPELLLAIKQEVDKRRVPGRFLLSGSANLALLGKVSESLAGRALYLTLHPLTRRERTGRLEEPPFLVRFLAEPGLPRSADAESLTGEEVLAGGMPPVVLDEARRPDLWFLGYEQTYLERDVRDLAQVTDLVAFRNVLRLAALRTGQILNQSEVARDAKLPATTVSRYLGLLETSFVLHKLPPFLRSKSSRLIKSPKLYCTDSGLAAHLTGVEDLGAAADEPLRGPLFETFVLQNLAGILGAHLPRAEVSFWSVQGRHEVDFVVSSGRRTVAIEVKAATRFGDRDLAGLRALAAATPGLGAGILAYNGREALQIGERLFAVPLGLLLS